MPQPLFRAGACGSSVCVSERAFPRSRHEGAAGPSLCAQVPSGVRKQERCAGCSLREENESGVRGERGGLSKPLRAAHSDPPACLSCSDDEDVAPLSAKFADICPRNNYSDAEVVASMNGLHSELNGGGENMALKDEVRCGDGVVAPAAARGGGPAWGSSRGSACF